MGQRQLVPSPAERKPDAGVEESPPEATGLEPAHHLAQMMTRFQDEADTNFGLRFQKLSYRFFETKQKCWQDLLVGSGSIFDEANDLLLLIAS